MIIRSLPRPFLTKISSFFHLRANPLPGGKCKIPFKPHQTHFTVRSMSASISSPAAVSPEKQASLLTGKEDDYGGVIVEMGTEPMEATVFASILKASLLNWKQKGKRGIWIKLPIELVNLVEPAVKEGFYYHHAEPTYLMLTHWIPETASTLPVNASHRVGIGAFVMKDNGEVLVVQEKGGKFRGTGIWKFPTGVVDAGEDICHAAEREVKEETGVPVVLNLQIDAKFVEIVAFRQSHKAFFEKSDLFFMCMLKPLSFDIKKQDLEIEAAEWMPFEEYAAQPFVQNHDLLKSIVDLCIAVRKKHYSGFSPVLTKTSFSDKESFLYLNTQDLNR